MSADDSFNGDAGLEGNAEKYSSVYSQIDFNSPLYGRTLYFLGSSVTRGYGALGESLADFISRRCGAEAVLSAVDGTTLADLSPDSYASRVAGFDKGVRPDCFVCQLSTNDVRVRDRGTVTSSFDVGGFDRKTTFGAVEYIAYYVKTVWDCPLLFYTNPYFDNPVYADMVGVLLKAAEKWGAFVLNLFSDRDFNAIPSEARKLYMKDDIHPTKAGYRDWLAPEFEKILSRIVISR
jgi:hypothetical protein